MPNQLAWGFISLQHLFDQRISALNADLIGNAIAQSVEAHQREVRELLNSVVTRTTRAQERYRLPGSATLQPVDEHGIPMPVRFGAFYDVGYPIQHGAISWGDNRITRELMTVGEANEYTTTMQAADYDWLRRHIMAAFLDNTSWVYEDDEVGGVTVLPLANGDTQQYLVNNVAAVDNHYLAQAGAITDAANPFPAMMNRLTEHAGNNGPYVAYISASLQSSVENLANFVAVADPDIAVGIGNNRLGGVPDGVAAFGSEVIGKVDGFWIVLWNQLPSGYIVGLAQGAPSSALAMREYPAASLQGLVQQDFSPDGNRMERRYFRDAGFGARNRTAAVIQQVGASPYVTPAGFATPLAA